MGGVKPTKKAMRRLAKDAKAFEQSTRSGSTGWYRQRHPRRGDDAAAFIRAQVNQVGGAIGTDATVPFDNVTAIIGTAPTADLVFQNSGHLAQDYADNEKVTLWQGDNNLWYPDKTGSGTSTGSLVLRYELTEAKTVTVQHALAKPLQADGTIDSGADPFYVIDDDATTHLRHHGPAGAHGVALFIENDYQEGIPGYAIITLEAPEEWIVGELASDVTAGTATFTPESEDLRGYPTRHIRPTLSDGHITVHDTLVSGGIATGSLAGEKWIVKYDESNEEYVLWRKLSAVSESGWYITAGTITAASGLTFGTGSAVRAVPGTDPAWVAGSGAVTIRNPNLFALPGSKLVLCGIIDGRLCITYVPPIEVTKQVLTDSGSLAVSGTTITLTVGAKDVDFWQPVSLDEAANDVVITATGDECDPCV